MKKLIMPAILILFVVFFISALPVTLSPGKNESEVFVLATLYSRHKTTPVYGIDTLQRLIKAIDPDVFVLDVTPAELQAQQVHVSKIEYPGAIFPLINDVKRPVYPAEPAEPVFTEIVNDVIKAHKDFRETQPVAAKAADQFNAGIFEALKASWLTPADVNGKVTDKALAGKRALMDKLVGPVDADGALRWTTNIVEVTLRAAREHPGKRVLVLIGVENCHGVRALLGQQNGIRLIDVEQWLRGRG